MHPFLHDYTYAKLQRHQVTTALCMFCIGGLAMRQASGHSEARSFDKKGDVDHRVQSIFDFLLNPQGSEIVMVLFYLKRSRCPLLGEGSTLLRFLCPNISYYFTTASTNHWLCYNISLGALYLVNVFQPKTGLHNCLYCITQASFHYFSSLSYYRYVAACPVVPL